MSSGVPVPVPWPPLAVDAGTYPIVIIDEGSYYFKDQILESRTEAAMVVRVEGLPDDTPCSIKKAVDAAVTQFPTYPCDSCLVLVDAGPLFGHTHLKGNSMVVGRGMTTDPGFMAENGVQTGTTGTIVLVKLRFSRPPLIGTI